MDQGDAQTWSLAEIGGDGDVCVELLEAHDPEAWRLQIAIGQFDVDCEVRSPEVVRELDEFFVETFRTGRHLDEQISPGHFRHMPVKQLTIGTVAGRELVLSKDGEYDDRYRLWLDVPPGVLAYTPTLAQTERLISAIRQLAGAL